MGYIKYKYALMIYNYRLKHKRMTDGTPWVKDDDSKIIPAVLQMSKTIQEKDGYEELANAEKDTKYKAWDASKGETAVQEKVGDPLAVKLYKAVVLKQKETRQSIRNISPNEKKKLITFRNKLNKIGIDDKDNYIGNDALKNFKKIFTDYNIPETYHELLTRYFSQLIDDYFEVYNKVSESGNDVKKVDELYTKKFNEFFDYFIGRSDKIPDVVKRRGLAELTQEPESSLF